MNRSKLNGVVVLSVIVISVGCAFAQEIRGGADERFRQGYVAETTDRDIEAAITLYRSVVDDPHSPSALRSESFYRLGLCDERLGRTADALEAYRASIAADPNQSQPYIEAARSSITRLEAALRPASSPESRPILKRGHKFFTPIHQFMLAGAGLAQTSNGGDGAGIELFGYEYMHTSGFALKISPLRARP